jgi:hypothetical protein
MRRMSLVLMGASTVLLAACGGGKHFANRPRPASPVDLTVYINDQRVSVSPASVGAGPVVFLVTNQANHNLSLSIRPAAGSGTPLAKTGPINPGGGTAQVQVDFDTGDYTIATGPPNSADASLGGQSAIRPARLHIGPPRPNGTNALLQP